MSADAPPHPAVYSDAVIDELRVQVELAGLQGQFALDPFAGLGKKIDDIGLHVIKAELQHGWAKQAHYGMVRADSTNLPFRDHTFSVVVTSPAYGNRMADKHNARDSSRRITYRHYLDRTGEALLPNNSGGMQWTSPAYKELHESVWAECARVLEPGGVFMLNVSDHIRAGKRMYVSSWHAGTLADLGFTLVRAKVIETPRMRRGQNHELRVQGEMILVFRKDRI